MKKGISNNPSGYLENIIALIPGHIYWKDKDGTYLGCNDQQAKSLGFSSPADIIGKTDYDLSPKELADKFREIDNTVIKEGKTYLVEETILLDNGSNAIVLSSKAPLKDNEGNTIGIVGISFDITAKKEAEQLRKQKELAEKQVELTNLISASVAHELRTPLRAISAGVGGIHKYLPSLITGYKTASEHKLDIPFINPAHFKSLLAICESMEAETKAAFNVIDMLLIKITHLRDANTSFSQISINQCINDILKRYPFEGEDEKLLNFREKEDFVFYGDELLLTHVLFNLLKNGIYYVRAASKGDIHIWTEVGEKQNFLHFKDTGLGISEKNLPHIFNRFFTTSAHGTGVGLAFCKMVMQEMGGDIQCYSKEGAFTEFVLSFPKVNPKPKRLRVQG